MLYLRASTATAAAAAAAELLHHVFWLVHIQLVQVPVFGAPEIHAPCFRLHVLFLRAPAAPTDPATPSVLHHVFWLVHLRLVQLPVVVAPEILAQFHVGHVLFLRPVFDRWRFVLRVQHLCQQGVQRRKVLRGQRACHRMHAGGSALALARVGGWVRQVLCRCCRCEWHCLVWVQYNDTRA